MNENNFNLNNQTINPTTNDGKKPKNSIFIKVLFLLIALVLIIGGVIFCYKTFFKNRETPPISNPDDDESIEKIDKSKDYVYDAEYEVKIPDIKESYMYLEKTVKLEEIIVPYLNVDAPAAQEINKKIKTLYDGFLGMYEMFSQSSSSSEEIDTSLLGYIKSNYSYTINDKIISILIKVNCTSTDSSEAEEYYTFNYDLKNKKELNFEDLCNKLNLNYEKALEKVNTNLDTSFKENFGEEVTSSEDLQESIADYIALNKYIFEKKVQNKTVTSFIDEKNQLNIIILHRHPFGGSGFYSDFITIT